MTKKPTYETQVIVRCSNDLRKKIEEAAKNADKTMTEWMRDTLRDRAEYETNKKTGLAEQKAAYIDGKLIDAIKYALTLPEVQQMIKDMLWKKNE